MAWWWARTGHEYWREERERKRKESARARETESERSQELILKPVGSRFPFLVEEQLAIAIVCCSTGEMKRGGEGPGEEREKRWDLEERGRYEERAPHRPPALAPRVAPPGRLPFDDLFIHTKSKGG